jgi:DNA polymerase III subunit epsilon
MYAIIDVETTGGSPVSEKLTEIAVYVHDGTRLVDEFTTLINPERKIPYYITALTGISNAMVADAPKFYEIARKIVEITDNCIFVAHNASFDYQFIRHEYKRLGYNYIRERLCTVQLSRKLVPGLPSYSLGNICKHFSIHIFDRHRASGDAFATMKLFEYLIDIGKDNHMIPDPTGINRKNLHPNLDPEILNSLPEETGIYYFYNDKQDLIYIGKSRNIRHRVLSHFRNFSSKKSIEMMNAIASVDYEITGSELIALLKESHEIKMHTPVFNRAQRRAMSNYGLYFYYDSNNYLRFLIDKNSSRQEIPLRSFATLSSAKAYLNKKADDYELCLKLCGLYPSSGACFGYEIARCHGACCGKELSEGYNSRAAMLLNENSVKEENFFLIEEGRNCEEYAIIQIHSGKYLGYGYTNLPCTNGNISLLSDCISRYDDNREIQQIIRSYLNAEKKVTLLPYAY